MESGARKLDRVSRDNFLIKIEKEMAFSGAIVPDEIELDGEKVRLKSIVFDISKRRGELSAEEISSVERITSLVAKKRKETISRIRSEDISYDEAESLYRLATGLRRALDTLYMASEPKPSMEESVKKARIEDGKRWLNLVKKVYGREEKGRQKFE